MIEINTIYNEYLITDTDYKKEHQTLLFKIMKTIINDNEKKIIFSVPNKKGEILWKKI